MNKQKPYKKFFVGQFVPKINANYDIRISQAGNNYQVKLVKIFKPINSASLIPIFFDDKLVISDKEIRYIRSESLFSKIRFINKIYRFIKDTMELKNIVKNENNIFYYNIDKQNFLSILISLFILRKKVYLIVADYPYYKLENLSDKFFSSIIKKTNGIIVLSSNILINKNQQLSHGLIERKEIIINNTNELNSNILLSGSLGKTTGFEIALEAISRRKNCILYITGRPYNYSKEKFDSLINEYSKKNNVKFLGLIEYSEYLAVLKNCDIAMSLRDPSDLEHQYNFPSKILEYLSKSKIVISTIEYNKFSNDLLFKCDFDVESLNSTLDYIYSLSPEIIKQLREDVYLYLNNNFTEVAFNEKINTLISNSND